MMRLACGSPELARGPGGYPVGFALFSWYDRPAFEGGIGPIAEGAVRPGAVMIVPPRWPSDGLKLRCGWNR